MQTDSDPAARTLRPGRPRSSVRGSWPIVADASARHILRGRDGGNRVVSTIVLAAIVFTGCRQIADLGIPTEIQEKGLLAALREPMPLDEPIPLAARNERIEHSAEMRALTARLEEFIAAMEDPTQRDAYVLALRGGAESRTDFFCGKLLTRDDGIGDAVAIGAAWKRLDDALAATDDPELKDERLAALRLFVDRGDADGAARLTEAIRDEWNFESDEWFGIFLQVDFGESVWRDALRTASEKDLDTPMGESLLQAIAYENGAPLYNPFESPAGIESLERRLRSPDDPNFAPALTQFEYVDDLCLRLWKSAKENPDATRRIEAAEATYRQTESEDAIASLVEAAGQERYATLALDALSRLRRLDAVEIPTGEAVARAKAYEMAWYVGYESFSPDAIELTPLASMTAKVGPDEEASLYAYRYRIPLPPEAIASGAPKEYAGVIFVDDRWRLIPPVLSDEEQAAAIDAAAVSAAETAPESGGSVGADPYANDPYAKFYERDPYLLSGEPEYPWFEVDARMESSEIAGAIETAKVQTLLDLALYRLGIDRFTVVDGACGGMYIDDPSSPRDLATCREDLLQVDERWKAFDLPLESLGLPPEALAPPSDDGE